MQASDVFVPLMAWELEVSWEQDATPKSEVDMNEEIKNVNPLTLATWHTNEFRFLWNHWMSQNIPKFSFGNFIF